MDRIIFGKRKNYESFIRSVHVLIVLLYIGLRKIGAIALLCSNTLQATLYRFSYLTS